MSTTSSWHGLSFEEEQPLVDNWRARGLRLRWARALVENGILTLDELHKASDRDLATLPAIGPVGLARIYELVERKPPGNRKVPERSQAQYERAWRVKIGDERFEHILELIVDMAGEALDRPSVVGGKALWAAAARLRVRL